MISCSESSMRSPSDAARASRCSAVELDVDLRVLPRWLQRKRAHGLRPRFALEVDRAVLDFGGRDAPVASGEALHVEAHHRILAVAGFEDHRALLGVARAEVAPDLGVLTQY